MASLIDKDTLVAEIKKRINFNEKLNAHSRLDECNAILSFLDTLEVKEVDFEKIWKEYFKYKGDVATVNIKHLAKHFFELGMRQSKNYNNNEE